MAFIVFHLMTLRAARLATDVSLRYDADPRCNVERGDVWERTKTCGEITYHRVASMRSLEGVRGEEAHVFMVPHCEPAVP